MPEGPELLYMAEFINEHDRKVGPFVNVSRSALATHPRKHPPFQVAHKRFRLSATSRGKELIITFVDAASSKRAQSKRGKRSKRSKQDEDLHLPKSLLVRAGMTGNFHVLQPGEEIPKHAHLRFHGASGHVLYFHDPRRFGSWHVDGAWGLGDGKRGPCIIQEADDVVQKIRASLASRVFSRPICEVMLDQAYFNGMGNYLRAEILHRAKIHPFSQARAVLADAVLQHEKQEMHSGHGDERKGGKEAEGGFFFHCQQVLQESVSILRKHGFGGDAERARVFEAWLQCYTKLNKKPDGLGRTMWFGSGLRKMRALSATSRKVQLLLKQTSDGDATDAQGRKPEETEQDVSTKEEEETVGGEPGRKRAKEATRAKPESDAPNAQSATKNTRSSKNRHANTGTRATRTSDSRRGARIEMKGSCAVVTPLRRSPRIGSQQRRTR